MNQRRIARYLRGAAVPLMAALLIPLSANAETKTVSGVINGLDCAVDGEMCPVDQNDPHIALESDFVLQQRDGEFYLLLNLPRETKVRYVLEDVKVTGEVNERYNAIKVDKLSVKKEEGFKTVWSKELMRQRALIEKYSSP